MLVSWLGLLNFLVLQWFGVRLARVVRKEFVTMHIGLDLPLYRDVTVGWKLLRWVCPLTGWWSDFWWIARRS
jgi:hypothetical protein